MPTEGGGRISTPRKTAPKKTTKKLTPEDVKNMKSEQSAEVEVNSRRLITKTVEFSNLHKTLQAKLSTKDQKDFHGMIQNLYNIEKLSTYDDGDIKMKTKSYNIETAKDFLSTLNCGTGTSGSERYYTVRNRSKQAFAIKEIHTQDGFYVFKSTRSDYYHAKIEDFDTNGIAAKSFSFGKPEVDKEKNRVKDFVIQESDTAISLIKEDEVISTIVGDHIVIVNKDKGHMVIVHNNLIEYLRIDKNGKQYHMGKPFSHHYGQIEKLKIDRNSNFLLLISKHTSESEDENVTPEEIKRLHIINRKTLEPVEAFDNIHDILHIDEKNDMTCLDKDGNLIGITTNFDQFQVGFVEKGVINELEIAEVSDTAASKLASILEISGLHIDPTKKTHIQSSEDSLTQELIDKIWETKVGKDNTFQSLFDAAESSEEIEHVNGIFLQIKLNPSVSMVKGLTEEMETSINKKRFEIKLKEIEISTKKIEDDFKALVENPPKKGYAYFTSMLGMEESLQSLEKERSQVPVINHDLDMMMSKLKDRLAAKVLTIQLENKSEVEIGVKSNIKKIKNFVDNIGFLSQITQIYSTDLYKETEKLISYLEDEEKKEYEALLASSIGDRVKQIEREMTEKDTKSKLETEKIISDIGGKIDNLSSVVKTIDDENVLSIMQEHDDLVKVIKAEIEELPKSEGEKLQLELENLFRTRKQHIRIDKIQAKGVIYSLDENGIDTSLYFSDRIKHKVDFKLIGQRQADGNIRLELHYDDGTVFNIEQYLQNPGRYSEGLLFKNMPTEMGPAEFITLQRNYIAWKNKGETKLKELRENIKKCGTKQEAQIKKKIKALQEQYKQGRSLELFANTLSTSLKLNPRSKLQLPNPKFMILEEDVKFFEQVSTALMIQKLEQKGIVVIESDPGIGKTESCRFIAGTTNREIERVQCSKMDPSDLFFSPQLKAGETTRKPAEWIKLMQKPGTMILFDEWDKLTPQCFERLHSLLDNARTIYDPQIGSIKANEDCLFIAARNTYERVSNPIVSRSNIITMNPPAETNEAFKIAKGYSGIEYFDKISYEEFKTIYANIGTDEGNEKLDEILIHIRSLVKIFKELRIKQAASTYNEKFEYEVSYRDAEQIFFMYQRNPKMSFKQIVSNLLIPKARAVVRDSEDKKIQESILSNIIESMIKE